MENAATLWSLYAADELLIRTWEDEAVVFDAYSGNTYLVDQMAVAILQYLDGKTTPQSKLVSECADRFGYEVDVDFTAYLISVLNRLAGLKLLHCESR